MGALKIAVVFAGLCFAVGNAARAENPTGTQGAGASGVCPDYSENKNVYFGDMHVHTALSFDAYPIGTRVTPDEAYLFAKGGYTVYLPGPYGDPERPVRLEPGEELDFVAITDHSEYTGALAACTFETSGQYNTKSCTEYREAEAKNDWDALTRVCERNPDVCEDGKRLHWKREVDAANAANASCSFTAFAGYEWTRNQPGPGRNSTVEGVRAEPQRRNFHRTVIFKNNDVPTNILSSFDEANIFNLWRNLARYCNDSPNRDCDSITIPHNSHGSGGRTFAPYDFNYNPLTREQAQLRVSMEPTVEVFQAKQSSECSIYKADEQGDYTIVMDDPECAFELYTSPDQAQPFSFAKDALMEGLRLERKLGVNPYRFGMIAATDTHNGTPGTIFERNHIGNFGKSDATPQLRLVDNRAIALKHNPGGLVGVWAPQNTREDIFTAIKNRETFATSGPRIAVRLFAGFGFADSLCAVDEPARLTEAYAGGVPMGSVLPPHAHPAAKPVLLISARAEPATEMAPGHGLQRIEIVKGWYDGAELREKVISVVEAANPGPGVDPATCDVPVSAGARELCTVWQDNEFAADHSVVYYARVLEVESCRWSTLQCLEAGVDCSDITAVEPGLAEACCLDPTFAKATIHERAWSSPIWYSPNAVAD